MKVENALARARRCRLYHGDHCTDALRAAGIAQRCHLPRAQALEGQLNGPGLRQFFGFVLVRDEHLCRAESWGVRQRPEQFEDQMLALGEIKTSLIAVLSET